MNNGLVSGHESRFMQNSTKMLGGVEPLEIVRAGVRRQKLACKLEHTLFHHPMKEARKMLPQNKIQDLKQNKLDNFQLILTMQNAA